MLTQKNGLVQLTVAQMVVQLSQAYSGLVRSSLPLDRFPSVMLRSRFPGAEVLYCAAGHPLL